jgi:hypothetical protein
VLSPEGGASAELTESLGLMDQWVDRHHPLSNSGGQVCIEQNKFSYSYKTESWVEKSMKTNYTKQKKKLTQNASLCIYNSLFRKIHKTGYLKKQKTKRNLNHFPHSFIFSCVCTFIICALS